MLKSDRGFAFLIGFGLGCLLAAAVYYAGWSARSQESGAPLIQTPRQRHLPVSKGAPNLDENRARISNAELEKMVREWEADEQHVESVESYSAESGGDGAAASIDDETDLPSEYEDSGGDPSEDESKFMVEAELVAKSPLPAFEEAPFRNVLVVYEYRILRHIRGLTDQLRLRVAHWAVRDEARQPALTYEIGGAHTLRLRAYESPDGAYVSNAFPMDDSLPLLMEEDAAQDAEGPGYGWNALLPPPPPSSLL